MRAPALLVFCLLLDALSLRAQEGERESARAAFIAALRSAAGRLGEARRASGGEVPGGPARPPLSEGLPAELAAGSTTDAALAAAGFLSFPGVEGGVHGMPPPIADSVEVDGVEPDQALLARIFADDHFVRLPDGARIRRVRRDGWEEWVYPAGTRVVHRFFVRSEPRSLFEFRIIEKRVDGRWAFGAYLPAEGGKLLLRRGSEEARFALALAGRRAEVVARRVETESCRHCHWMLGEGDAPEELAGPCGFSPANPHLTTSWAREFRSSRGYEPFE